MESTISLEKPAIFTPTETIYPNELIPALNHYADKIKVLSLDCFDTLLWRKTATPIDVFFHLQHKPTFKSLGINGLLRTRLEMQARNLKILRERNNEVILNEIYQAGFPNLTLEQLQALNEEELTAEIEMCYAFPPILECIQYAHQRGLKIVIASNTYLTKNQLKRLLAHCLPEHIISMIDDIFCSSEYGKAKNNGLFEKVIEQLQIPAQHILHIGDHATADLAAARSFNLNALQLLHHPQIIHDLLRLQSTAAVMLDADIRYKKPLLYPFRGLLAKNQFSKPEELIGYASVGPILYTFARFIEDEINQLTQSGKNPKVLFLLRDAHLPQLACETLMAKKVGHRVFISRFASIAASFRTQDDINRYLMESVATGRFNDVMRQLLLPEEIAAPLLQVTLSSPEPIMEFIKHIHTDAIQQIIFKQSLTYRQRLIKYLEKEIDLKRGDTLMFVDLGYSGTAQRQLEPLFREILEVEIIGRYLIELTVPDWKTSRKGLLDPSCCDDRIMTSLVSYIALLEQICTSNDSSVINYDNDGHPIFSSSSISNQQHHKLDKIQQECLRFVKEAKQYFNKNLNFSMAELRDALIAELGRSIFFPTEKEINYLESFQFDLNLGTQDVLNIFNQAEGLSSLKKRGLFFSFMEKNQKTMRTNYPAELRAAGMELVLTVLAQHRFGLDIGLKDMSLRRDVLNVSSGNATEKVTLPIEALLTYDGYYSLTVPLMSNGHDTVINMGEKYAWVQIDSAEILPIDAYLNKRESLYAENYWPVIRPHDMTHKGGNLYECHSADSQLIIPASTKQDNKKYVVRLVFRPIAKRESIQAPLPA